MNPRSAASQYTAAKYENAPPIKIVQMMYDGAIRFVGQAQAMDPVADAIQFNDKLTRAEAIIAELRMALENDHAPELCQKLESLYFYAERQIREAFLERTTEGLDEAVGVLKTLRSAWGELALQMERAA